jgi:hypothetical protein
MAGKRRDAVPTFAEVVRQMPDTEGEYDEAVPVVNYAKLDEFTDADGVRWARRGGVAEGKALQRLLTNPSVRVLHDYMGESTEIPASERERFWATAQEQMAKSPYAAFYGSEFKNEQREHLLVIQEHC